MKRPTRVQKNTAILNKIRKELPERTEELVVKMGMDMEHAFALEARRDTNAMAESVYTQTNHGAYKNGSPTSVASVKARALALNPDAEIEESPVPGNRTTAYVKPIVKYFIWQEFGSARGITGSFAMHKARKTVQNKLRVEYKDIFKKIATGDK